MRGQGHQRQHGDEYGIQSRMPIRELSLKFVQSGFKEIAGGIQWHSRTTLPVPLRKHRQQKARSAENDIEEILPHPVFDVGAEFNADAAEMSSHNTIVSGR